MLCFKLTFKKLRILVDNRAPNFFRRLSLIFTMICDLLRQFLKMKSISSESNEKVE